MNANLSEIRDAMAGLRGRKARIIASQMSELTGLSLRQIYSLSRDLRQGRTKRKDLGARRIEMDPEVETVVMKIIHEHGIGAQLALDTAVGSGLIDPSKAPSAATILRRMRSLGVGARSNPERTVCRRWQADAPNDLHQADSTVSAMFYLDDQGGVGYESPRQRYKNKPGNKRPRLILYVLIDDYSRVTYARYYLAENALCWLDFVFHAWGRKDDPTTFPFSGVPKVLYTDNGSCINSARFKAAMKALEIDLKFHEPEHPQAKGKCERAIRTLQTRFEKLFLLKKPGSLDEANALLYKHLIQQNMREHGGTEEVPFQRWMDRREAIRALPEERILAALSAERVTRRLGPDLTFSLHGETFMAPYMEPFRSMPEVHEVTVEFVKEIPLEASLVLGAQKFSCLHIAKGAAFPALPAAKEAKTVTSETQARLKAAGLESLDPFSSLDKPLPNIRFLPKGEEVIDHSAPPEEQQLTWVESMRTLQKAGVCQCPAEPDDIALVDFILRGRERVPETEVLDIARRFRGTNSGEVLAGLVAVSNVATEARAASAG